MAAFAVGVISEISMGPDVVRYLQGIDATLSSYAGRFLVHGGNKHHLEGAFGSDLIVIEFPNLVAATRWYESPAYQALLPLRTRHARSDVFLIEGVPASHQATDILNAKGA